MTEKKEGQSKEKKSARENPMRNIRLEKVTINMGVGEPGPRLENAKKIVEAISGSKAVITKSKKRNTFGVAKGREIGVKTTLRGEAAMQFLKNAVRGVDSRLHPRVFDANGNFSFGIKEYINIPGAKYDPQVGIVGMDIAVTLERPGFRVKKRSYRPAKVGRRHAIRNEEAMKWAEKELNVKVTAEQERGY
jgi:large subunit ribosomal protein L5